MPPSYVKPCVKPQKNDAADAEAICEAVTRPTMRFVEVKSPERQSVMVLHRARLMLMRQRIELSNAIRGHMAEFGVVARAAAAGHQIERVVSIYEAGWSGFWSENAMPWPRRRLRTTLPE
jgi:transposase